MISFSSVGLVGVIKGAKIIEVIGFSGGFLEGFSGGFVEGGVVLAQD